MKQTIYFYSLVFGIGAVGYCFIELLWRGYTHPSMAIAGGISFCFISIIQKHMKNLRFIYRCLASGLVITVIELLFGIIFNLALNKAIWNYGNIPINLYGQICLLYTVMWCFLSIPMLIVSDILRNNLIYNKNHKV